MTLYEKQVSTLIWIYLSFLIAYCFGIPVFFFYNTCTEKDTTVSSRTEGTSKSQFPEESLSLSIPPLSTFNDRCLFSVVGNVLSNKVVVCACPVVGSTNLNSITV